MDRIKKFFSSTRLAVVLLVILAITSIMGTIIIQNGPQEVYLNKYGPGLFYFFRLLSLTDLYHSWWFFGILATLSINLGFCSLNRLPSLLRLFAQPKKGVEAQYILGLPLKNKAVYSVNMDRVSNLLRERLEEKNYHLLLTDQKPAEVSIFAEKGRLGRLGPYITHLSILLILLGGMIGGLWGFKEYVEIDEGDTVSIPHTGFRLRLEDFEVEYYPDSKMPKDYKSALAIIDGGKEVLRKTIEVNHPLIYKGIWLYQSSYGLGEVKVVTINVAKSDTKPGQDFRAKTGETFDIPGTDLKVKVARFVPDFVMAGSEVYSRSEEPDNPAAQLEVYEKGKLKLTQWVFYKFPDYHQSQEIDRQFKLSGFEASHYSGLMIVKDPGVAVVWTGCGLLVAGLMATFFISHRRLWVILRKTGKKKMLILIGGKTNKDRPGFEEEFSQIICKREHRTQNTEHRA